MRSVYVTITGQVWLDEESVKEIQEREGCDESEAIRLFSIQTASDLFPTDTPIKERGISVHMETIE